jgi:hypothetical protein
MIRIAVIAAALSLVLAIPAAAQTATAPGGGTVGSTTLRNGFPAAGGAIALPSQPASPGISGSIASPAGGTAASPAQPPNRLVEDRARAALQPQQVRPAAPEAAPQPLRPPPEPPAAAANLPAAGAVAPVSEGIGWYARRAAPRASPRS